MNIVEFKKKRDLGTIITDSFGFIRNNWKGYFGTIIKIAGIPLVILIIAMGFYMSSIFGLIGMDAEGFNDLETVNNLATFGGFFIIAMLSGIICYVLMQMSALYYIKSYIENDGNINNETILQNVKDNFWRFLGFGILMFLMVFVGMLFCGLPGIWIAVVLSLGTSILVFENKSVGDTISHCFTLIKNHWFETFGCVFVIAILVGIIGQAFAMPAMIYQMIKMGTIINDSDPTAALNIFSDPIYLSLSALSYVGQFLLSSITLIAGVFIYYDLNEQKNATGSIEKIDNLGNN